MKKNIFKILHYVSLISGYSLIFSIIFLLQSFTIGQISIFNNLTILNIFYFKDIVFLVISFLIIKKFVKVYSPYEKYLN